jgi:hypothetical protein
MKELEEFNRKLDHHEKRLYGRQVQETTDLDDEYQGAEQQPT